MDGSELSKEQLNRCGKRKHKISATFDANRKNIKTNMHGWNHRLQNKNRTQKKQEQEIQPVTSRRLCVHTSHRRCNVTRSVAQIRGCRKNCRRSLKSRQSNSNQESFDDGEILAQIFRSPARKYVRGKSFLRKDTHDDEAAHCVFLLRSVFLEFAQCQ